MAKVGMPKLESKMFSGWMFVLVAGLLLALIAIIDSGGLDQAPASTADGSTGCRLEVTADELNVRSEPRQDAPLAGTLTRGTVVDGTLIVTNFYRQLEDGTWAVTEFLTPVPGSICS